MGRNSEAPSAGESPVSETAVPTVSVVVINYKGAADTIACLNGIKTLNYPADSVETIVVDNASGDGSVAEITTAHPRAIVVPLATRDDDPYREIRLP